MVVTMEVLRTSEERFAGLEGWPYEPRFTVLGSGLRVHHVDEGPPDGPVTLLAHGEPTWGYLYRKMIPALVAAGRRVIVPDLIGFGRSDKPVDRAAYTYEAHVAWTGEWLDALDLRDITLFGQDWGGLLFLVHVGLQPERFAGVVAANTALGDPDLLAALGPDGIAEVASAFLRWRAQAEAPALTAAWAVGDPDSALNQTGHALTPGEQAAYDAPFPDETFFAGVRQFPLLVPLDDADPPASMLRAAWAGLESYDRPFLTAFAEHEDVTRAFEAMFQTRVPGAAGRTHLTVPASGHFLQEHQPDLLVEAILSLA